MRNIEVFATLRGRKSAVGGIGLEGEGILGSGGIGPLLEIWTPRPLRADEIAAHRFDDAVRTARHAIFAASPQLQFVSDGDRLSVALEMKLPELPGIALTQARLVTQPHATSLQGSGPWALGSVRLVDATRFVQIDLTGTAGETAGFVTQAVAQGLPEEEQRLRALMSDMIKTPDEFLTFVSAMLEVRPDIDGMMRAVSQSPRGEGRGAVQATPMLESLLATFLADDGPARLAELDRMLRLLTPDSGTAEMQDFVALWAEFKAAAGKRA